MICGVGYLSKITVKITIFSDMTPYISCDRYLPAYRGTYCFHFQGRRQTLWERSNRHKVKAWIRQIAQSNSFTVTTQRTRKQIIIVTNNVYYRRFEMRNTKINRDKYCVMFWSMFTRKVSTFYLLAFLCPSVYLFDVTITEQLNSFSRNFMLWHFSKMSWQKLYFGKNRTAIADTLHEDLHAFLWESWV